MSFAQLKIVWKQTQCKIFFPLSRTTYTGISRNFVKVRKQIWFERFWKKKYENFRKRKFQLLQLLNTFNLYPAWHITGYLKQLDNQSLCFSWLCLDRMFKSHYCAFSFITVKPVQNDHPLVQTEAVLIDRWSSIRSFPTLNQCTLAYNERGDRKKKNHKHRSKREWAKVGFSAWALLGLPTNFCRGNFPKRRFRIVTWSLHARKTRWWCMKDSVPGRTRQVVAIRSAVSALHCPCTKKQSLEADGRYSRWSLKPAFTVCTFDPKQKEKINCPQTVLILHMWWWLCRLLSRSFDHLPRNRHCRGSLLECRTGQGAPESKW